jgi:hypothetical protein
MIALHIHGTIFQNQCAYIISDIQNKVIFPHLFRQKSSLEGYEYHQVCHKSNQTGATNGAETACNSGAP